MSVAIRFPRLRAVIPSTSPSSQLFYQQLQSPHGFQSMAIMKCSYSSEELKKSVEAVNRVPPCTRRSTTLIVAQILNWCRVGIPAMDEYTLSKSRYRAVSDSRRRLPKIRIECSTNTLSVRRRRCPTTALMKTVSKEYHVAGPKPQFKSAKTFLDWFDDPKDEFEETAAETERQVCTDLNDEMDWDMCSLACMLEEDPAVVEAIIQGREERRQQRIMDCMAAWASGILESWIEEEFEKIWDFDYFDLMASE